MKNLTLLCDSQCELGEGPLWVAQEQAIYWVDIVGKTLHKINIDGSGHQIWHFDSEISSINYRSKGQFIVTFRNGFALLDLPNMNITPIESPETLIIDNRFNDAKVDYKGNLWAGTMDEGATFKSGALYRLSKDYKWNLMDEGYCITNGPAFSPCNKYLYHTDTLQRLIYRFRFNEDGSLIDKIPFITIPEEDGYPDGMTVDTEGNLWVCHFAGAKVVQFDSTGKRLNDFNMPVSNITSCTFVGDKLDRMVFTTAKHNLSQAQLKNEPTAGGLYIASVNSTGIKVEPFAG